MILFRGASREIDAGEKQLLMCLLPNRPATTAVSESRNATSSDHVPFAKRTRRSARTRTSHLQSEYSQRGRVLDGKEETINFPGFGHPFSLFFVISLIFDCRTDRTMAEVLNRLAELQETVLRMSQNEIFQGKATSKRGSQASSTPINGTSARFERGSYSAQDQKTSPDSSSSLMYPSNEAPQTPLIATHISQPFGQSMETEQKPDPHSLRARQEWTGDWNMEPHDILPDLPQGEETMPERHSTQAHMLLQDWPAVQQCFDKDCPKDYPAVIEMNRGTLQLHGRGEGTGVPSADWNEYTVGSPAGSSHSDEMPSHTSSPPQDSQVQAMPAFDEQTCKRLLHSYLTHMHPMQPFLVRSRIEKQVFKFVRRLNPRPHATNSPLPAPRLVDTESPGTYRPMKKRRTEDGAVDATNGFEQQQRRPDKTITHAIVLLVLALGEICENNELLPAPTRDRSGTSEPVPRSAYKESPATPMSVSSPHQPEYRYGQYKSPSGVLERSQTGEFKRNSETFPGLKYFTIAVEILGGVLAGTEIPHAQGFLLAALYLGQLGRVNESWSWIWNAGRVCRLLVRKYVTPPFSHHFCPCAVSS